MKKPILPLLFFIVTLITACNGTARPTPTPFPQETGSEQALNPTLPRAIGIIDLAADPEAFANQYITLTGRYRQLPLLVCQTDPHPSPATWQLQAEDGSVVAVGGFDSQIRSLLPNDLTMTVAGVWQLFDGPVGCGKNAVTRQIWYLKVSDILSPSPIARVTLTPTGDPAHIADLGDETAVATPTNLQTPAATPTQTNGTDNPETPSTTPTVTSTTPPTPSSGSTPTFAPSPTGEGVGSSGTPTATGSSGTATPTTSGSASPTATGGTPTSTASSGNPTPTPGVLTTATRNPSDFDTVEFDDLSPETPVLELLEAEQAHLWPIVFDYTGAITVTAVGEPTMNLVLEILNPANDVVIQADNGGNGALESIINTQLNTALDYKIRIYNLNAVEGDYCLIFSEGGGFPDTIKGRLEFGQTVNNQVEVLGIDYWCFLGASGDTISITATATGSTGDFALGLFGPPDFDAIGDVFTDSMITNASLAENGMYIIGVLDFDAEASSYSLQLIKN